MKNSSKIGLIVSILCFLQFSTYSMQVNLGYITSFNCDISTYIYRNEGTINGINNVKMHVSSLAGSGTISAHNKDVDIQTGSFDYTGTISAGGSCDIKANTFAGTATIEAPYITITSDEFKFSGTLSCDKKCVIYSKKDIDTDMFKRVGTGEFKVVISPYAVKHFSYEGLSSKSYNEFCSNCLNFTENDIENKIKEIRTHAALNFIDDKAILENIKETLQSQANFHKDRLQEQQDMDSLYVGLTKCGISTVGLFTSYLIFKNEQSLTQKFKSDAGFIKFLSVIIAGLSMFPAAFSSFDFYNWRNPRHPEKYEGLSLIISRIEHALVTERIAEEQIINL